MIRTPVRRLGRLLLVLAALWGAVAAAANVAVPELRARVTDQAATFDAARRAALEGKLQAFEAEKGSQVAVLIVPSTQPETIEQYSIRVVDAWKLGRAEQDDGVLLLVARNDRTLRIEVGQGLEGAIPDALARRIIDETIVPAFRQGDFAGGIEAGVDRILGLIRGEPLPPPRSRASGGAQPFDLGVGLFIVVLTLGQFLRRVIGRLAGASLAAAGALAVGALLFGWLAGAIGAALMFIVVLTGEFAGAGGYYGGARGGGFSSGGGGFSGGGGGFSGGGASGRW